MYPHHGRKNMFWGEDRYPSATWQYFSLILKTAVDGDEEPYNINVERLEVHEGFIYW